MAKSQARQAIDEYINKTNKKYTIALTKEFSFDIEISLNCETATQFINSVVNEVIVRDENGTITYNPEMYQSAYECAIIKYYTTLGIEDKDKVKNLLHCDDSYVYKIITNNVDSTQLEAIKTAINDKIKVMMDIQIKRENCVSETMILSIANLIMKVNKYLDNTNRIQENNMKEMEKYNLDPESVSKFVDVISKFGSLDEDKIVKSVLGSGLFSQAEKQIIERNKVKEVNDIQDTLENK